MKFTITSTALLAATLSAMAVEFAHGSLCMDAGATTSPSPTTNTTPAPTQPASALDKSSPVESNVLYRYATEFSPSTYALTSVEQCIETCAATPGCLAYSFYPSKTPIECMLYKWIGPGYEVSDDVMSGTMLTVNSSCSIKVKMSFTSAVLSTQNAETVEECCTTCKTKTGCNAFTFRSTGTHTVCQYMSNANETEQADLVTSGTI